MWDSKDDCVMLELCHYGPEVRWLPVHMLLNDLELSADAWLAISFMQSRRLSLMGGRTGLDRCARIFGPEFRTAYGSSEEFLAGQVIRLRESNELSLTQFLDELGKAIRHDFPDYEG